MLTRRSVAASLGAVGLGAGAGLTPSQASPSPATLWPNAAKAACSLTYDDGLDSQLEHAVGQLQAHRLKATFFLTLENMDARLKDWVGVRRLGHEVGNHTVTHQCDLRLYTPRSFVRKELAPMERYLDAHFGPRREHLYAYPCSVTNLGGGGPDEQLARYSAALKSVGVRAARTSDGPPNSLAHVRRRPYDLRASTPTYDEDNPELALAYVREAISQGGWAVLVFHDVLPARVGAGDTSIAHHEAILKWLTGQPIWIAPMGEVLGYLDGRGLAGRSPGRSGHG